MRSIARLLFLGALSGVASFLACNGDNHLGGLVVAITSNVSAPKDVDSLGLAVSVDGVTKFSNVYGVSPNGVVTLPATLVLEEPSNPAVPVNVRIMAFSSDGNVRIVRDAITTIPHARVAVLRVQLSALSFDTGAMGHVDAAEIDRSSDPGAQPTLKGARVHLTDTTMGFNPFLQVTSGCDLAGGFGNIDGICQDAKVDSATLPDATSTQLAPTPSELASCFDVGQCFATAKPVDTGTTCSFAYTGDPAKLNVAVVTDGAGFPTRQGFVAPLDLDPLHGFSLANGVVTLAKGVCAPNSHRRAIIVSSDCASKTIETPITYGGDHCSPSTFDAGTPPDASGEGG